MIKFIQPYEGNKVGDTAEMGRSLELMLVHRNVAEYCEKPVTKKRATRKKVEETNAHVEGGE